MHATKEHDFKNFIQIISYKFKHDNRLLFQYSENQTNILENNRNLKL